jgi:hypothetical protein
LTRLLRRVVGTGGIAVAVDMLARFDYSGAE